MLQITNGDAVLEVMRAAQLPGQYLSWLDVLHDGPVPQQPPDDLAHTRARFIDSLGWESYDAAHQRLLERDAALSAHAADDDEVILWFEHDLFDQLQLIQILDRLATGEFRARLSLINIGEFPGVPNFVGLGQLNPQQLAGLLPLRRPITGAQLSLGREAWKAFTSTDPLSAHALATQHDTLALPFLRAAFLRWLEEFPSTLNGLSRTEQQLLRAASEAPRNRREIYSNSSDSEEAIFMGDSSAFWRLDRLTGSPKAALANSGDTYQVTDFGRALLEERADWIRDRDGINTWLGGTHLSGPDAQWRWDSASKCLVTVDSI